MFLQFLLTKDRTRQMFNVYERGFEKTENKEKDFAEKACKNEVSQPQVI